MVVGLRGIQIQSYLNFFFLDSQYSVVKLLQAVATFLNVFIYLLYVFRAEPTTMQRQLTGVSKSRWGWIIPAYGSLSMSYRIPKGSGQRPINDERRLFTPQESKIQEKR